MAFPAVEYGITDPIQRDPSIADVLGALASRVGGAVVPTAAQAIGAAAPVARETGDVLQALIRHGNRKYSPNAMLALQGVPTAPPTESTWDVIRGASPTVNRAAGAVEQGWPFYPTQPIVNALGPRSEEDFFRLEEQLYPPPYGPQQPGNLASPEQVMLDALQQGAPGLGGAPQLGEAPEIVAPDYARIREALGQMTPGEAPTAPSTWDKVQAGLAHASLASAQGQTPGQVLALAAGAGVLGAMEQETAYERRMDQYSKRISDIAQKRAEVESNIATLDTNREMANARMDADYALRQATLDSEHARLRADMTLRYAIHNANIAMERMKLSQPFVGFHDNRYVIQDRDENGNLTGAPIMYTVNEVSDGIASVLANARMAAALGAGGKNDPTLIDVQVGNIKKTFRGPIGESLSHALLLTQTKSGDPALTAERERIRKEIIDQYPFVSDLDPVELSEMVETRLIHKLSDSLLMNASAGRDVPMVPTPGEKETK